MMSQMQNQTLCNGFYINRTLRIFSLLNLIRIIKHLLIGWFGYTAIITFYAIHTHNGYCILEMVAQLYGLWCYVMCNKLPHCINIWIAPVQNDRLIGGNAHKFHINSTVLQSFILCLFEVASTVNLNPSKTNKIRIELFFGYNMSDFFLFWCSFQKATLVIYC